MRGGFFGGLFMHRVFVFTFIFLYWVSFVCTLFWGTVVWIWARKIISASWKPPGARVKLHMTHSFGVCVCMWAS